MVVVSLTMANITESKVGTPTIGEYYAAPRLAPRDPGEYARKQKAGSFALRTSEPALESAPSEGWQESSLCSDPGIDPDIFFPSDGAGVEVARKICAICPVIAPCLEDALTRREINGVRGGTSERERKRILKSRRAAAVKVEIT